MTVESRSLESPFHFVAAVDGSKDSQVLVDNIVSIMKSSGSFHDKLTILHVAENWAEDKKPYHQQPGSVKEFFTSRLTSRLPRADWNINILSQPPNSSTGETLLRYTRSMPDADFFCVGYAVKQNNQFGSVLDMSLRATAIPSIVDKSRTPNPECKVFVVGVDGMNDDGVNLALRLRKANDTVHLLHIEDPAIQQGPRKFDSDAVEARYRSYANCRFHRIIRPRDKPVGDTLVDFADEVDATYLIIGIDGLKKLAYGEKGHIGSVSDRVVRKASCNVILMQSIHGVYQK